MSKNWPEVHIYDPAREEILDWPIAVKKELGSILTKIQKGKPVGYPDTERMASVGPGVFEIRMKDAIGIYRAFYITKTDYGILVFHSFQKKSQKTPVKEIETGRIRLKTFLEELKNG